MIDYETPLGLIIEEHDRYYLMVTSSAMTGRNATESALVKKRIKKSFFKYAINIPKKFRPTSLQEI